MEGEGTQTWAEKDKEYRRGIQERGRNGHVQEVFPAWPPSHKILDVPVYFADITLLKKGSIASKFRDGTST